MKTSKKLLPLLCAGILLAACAGFEGREPVSALGAQEHYLLARTAHLAGRQEEALAAYEAALRADGAHVDARNGLATLHAQQGAFDKAVPLWQALTAAATGAQSAYLWRNLGHALVLQGQYEQARHVLQQACLLDPLHPRAWRQLGAAFDKLGQADKARQMARQAALLEQHDIRADYAAAAGTAPPAIEQAVRAGSGDWAETQVRQLASGMFELRRVDSRAPSLPAAAVTASLEIRNGNGVRGMARALSRQMDRRVLRVVRLSNERGFGVQRTRVEYRGAHRAAAELLAGRFGNASVRQATRAAGADLRLVIGRDLVRPDSFVRHQTGTGTARDNEMDHTTTSGAAP